MAFEPEDHAILVGITRYPGLTTLGGPENDAQAFHQWLTKPDGGNVDPANVTLISSTGFPPTGIPEDPYDANPTDTQFRKALNKLCRGPDKAWLPRAGRRLWLFLAGHGFTAGAGSDPSLLTAQAQLGDNAHIAAKRYVDRISNAGFFDEIILVMDACQDVMRSASVNDPTWTPPDRGANAIYFEALAAPRGSKSREAPVPTGETHGFFTRTIVDALTNAAADAQGWVTAEAVRQDALNRWNADGLPARTGVARPPIDAPFGMNLYRRQTPLPTKPDGGGDLSKVADNAEGPVHPASAEEATTNVKFHLPIDTSLVRVFDQADRQIFHGAPSDLTSLVAGRYTAQVRVGDALERAHFDVASGRGAEVSVTLDQPRFSSPVPLPGTRTTHEWQSEPVAALRRDLARLRADTRAEQGALLVFARDWTHQMGVAWSYTLQPEHDVRLRRIGASPREEASPHVTSDPNAGWSSLLFPNLAPGTYTLGFRQVIAGRPFWQELVIAVVDAPYRTEVFLGTLDDGEGAAQRLDPDSAAILVLPNELAGVDEVATRTEAARLAFLDGRAYSPSGAILDELIDTSPLVGLYVAYALTLAANFDPNAIASIVDRLERGALRTTSDVSTLRRWLQARQGKVVLTRARIEAPPMFARGWDLQREVDLAQGQPGRTPGEVAQRRVARWRIASSNWTVTSIAESRRADERLIENVQLPSSLERGRLTVDPNASALEQSVRRATLNRWEDEEASGSVDPSEVGIAAARAWNLEIRLVYEAMANVFTASNVSAKKEEGPAATTIPLSGEAYS